MLRGPRQAGSVYDPAAGIFAGAAVGAATGVGISPNPRAAGYEEQAAQGIFQLTKIHPGPPWWADRTENALQAFRRCANQRAGRWCGRRCRFLKKDTP